MLIVTAISAAILAFLSVKLSLNVIAQRRKHNVSVGDGGHEDLLRAIRAQANLTEYAPIALILLACLEMNGAPIWLTSLLALAFIVGRLLHPLGMKGADHPMQPRVRGMQLTLLSLLALGVASLVVTGMSVLAY